MQAKALKDKIGRIEEMLAKLEDAVQEGNPVLELPSASGLIAECQTDCIAMAAEVFDECGRQGRGIWLDGRSLLASCRTQNLLPWETSVEAGMFEEDWEALKGSALAGLGLQAEENSVKPAAKPQYGRICPEVRIIVWTRDAQTVHAETGSGTAWTTEDCILPLKKRILNGMEFDSPSNAWSILEAEYGSGWKKIV